MERLDKIIATGGGVSRSDARKAVLKGQVTVNSSTVRDIAYKVDPNADLITLNGTQINYKKYVYLVINKPCGVLTATEDKRQKTVLDLVPNELYRKDLFPVGRLDKNTTGLLILTNDGDFGHTLLSPNHKVPKKYLVTLDGEIANNLVEKFKAGLTLADGTKLSPAGLEILQPNNKALVTIIEGKYHQIKRMFGLFELGVDALERVSFAGLNLPNDLSYGQVRELTKAELDIINNAKNTIK